MEVIWDIRTRGARELSVVLDREKDLAAILGEIAKSCPVTTTVAPFQGPSYFRAHGHARSFCLRTAAGGCLIFKGTEPMSTDYAKVMREAWDRRLAFDYSRIEHFTLRENEIYLAMTSAGSIFCANQSLAWTKAYHHRFKTLPRTPFPLLSLRIPSNFSTAFSRNLRPFISDRGQLSALKRAEWLSAGGLGVYVYYYPSEPLRAAHVKGLFPGSGGIGVQKGAKTKTLDPNFDIGNVIQQWISLFSSMLVAGYLPTTKIHTGNCLQLQNLVVDGGFCDIDSLEPLNQFTNDKDLVDALLYCVREMVSSISEFVGIERFWGSGPVWAMTWNLVRDQVASMSKAGRCDPRITQILGTTGTEILRHLI